MTNKLPNLKINPEELPKRVLVCGDPFRAKKIATLLENAAVLA